MASGESAGSDWLSATLREWGINALTDVQTKAIEAGVAAGISMVVGAPTSSGKTLVGEIAVVANLRQRSKAIYLVSHKALADQKYLDFVARFGEGAVTPIATIGLNTGDREEGDIDAQLMVATYEKALGLILSGQLDPRSALIVADEAQILGEPSRGPEVETLLAVLRQRGVKQFVALTATVENPEDLAGWMKCKLVRSSVRDVPLHQEIWFAGRCYRITLGVPEGSESPLAAVDCADISSVVSSLVQAGRGPVLVFTESRNEAANFATAFGRIRPRVGEGIEIANQLELFSEPTDHSDRLRENAERRVIFHTADLSPQERQVIEAALLNSQFDVCFATPTLAAGVNFPFRTIVFPKLTYEWRDGGGGRITRSEFRNMSGRAGRLGMHTEGYAVLLPKNRVELSHANELVLPENEVLFSQLITLSLRRSVLSLIASKLASSYEEVIVFFQNTLFWYQLQDRNPAQIERLCAEAAEAIRWLVDKNLLQEESGTLLPTPLGTSTALSGLLPTTAVQFADILRRTRDNLDESFDACIHGLVYAACASDEFCSDRPPRFLPSVSRSDSNSLAYWDKKFMPVMFDRTNSRLAKCAHSICLYVEGMAERKITFQTGVSAGGVHRLSIDVAWVIDGLHKISSVPELNCSQAISNQIAQLSRRIRWGAPSEALDVIRVAQRHNVPGFGRQRAMALLAQGISTLHDVLSTAREKLAELLRNDHRAEALLNAASNVIGMNPNRLATSHIRVAKALGLDDKVGRCNEALGVDYEKAIVELLREEASWAITVLDDGVRQNVPDFLISLGGQELLLECKTCTKSPALIKKEDAWAVLQKSADFDANMRRVTLGKPAFDETSKKKVAGSHDIALVEHSVFVEGVLRVLTGTITAENFLVWLSAPGLAELDRIGGTPTFKQ